MTAEVEHPQYRGFVIGPIGNRFAPIGTSGRDAYEDALEVFEKVIMPACEANSVEPIRADQIAQAGEINEQIFKHLRTADVVIADLSGGNPNVMYELGLRHTINKLTIQIGEFGQLPFDFAAVRTIQFSRSDRGLIDARKALEKALVAGLTEGPDEVTATRVWRSGGDSLLAEPIPDVPGDELEEDEEDGLMERVVKLEAAFPRLTATTEAISAAISGMGEEATKSTADLVNATSAGASAQARIAVVARYATALQPRADELSRLTLDFQNDMSELDGSVSGTLKMLERHPDLVERPDYDSFLQTISTLARTSRDTTSSAGQFAEAIRGLGDMSRVLRRPSKQINDAMQRMFDAMALTDSWDERATRLRKHAVAKEDGEVNQDEGQRPSPLNAS